MNAPNQITVLRILLVPLFVGLLLYWTPALDLGRAAFAVFLLACVTDAIDGWLSRRLNQKTRFGVLADPLADKMLLTSAYVCLAFFPNIPQAFRIEPWLALLVVSRDVILLAGALLIHTLSGRFEPKTNLLGKATTCLQMAFVLAVFIALPGPALAGLAALAAAATVASAIIYIGAGARLVSNGAAV